MPFTLVITTAGRANVVNPVNTGTAAATITQVGVSATAVTPAAGTTTLVDEIKRLSGVGGGTVADDTIHVSALDESTDAYTCRSVALYLGDGTLFAIGSDADPLFNKAAGSNAAVAIDIVLADIAASSISFGDTSFMEVSASTTQQGLVELATGAETITGTDPARAVTPAGAAAAFVKKGGDTMTGPLVLPGAPGEALHAATKGYVDGLVGGAALGYTPVNKAGDTMTGPLVVPSTTLAGHASRKDYVDGLVTAAALLAKLVTVDGSGSGLDADLLDGQQGSYYTNIVARLGYTPMSAGAFTSGSNADGWWIEIAGLVVIQGGTVVAPLAGGSSTTKALPRALANPPLGVFFAINDAYNTYNQTHLANAGRSATQVTFRAINDDSGGNSVPGWDWWAIGI